MTMMDCTGFWCPFCFIIGTNALISCLKDFMNPQFPTPTCANFQPQIISHTMLLFSTLSLLSHLLGEFLEDGRIPQACSIVSSVTNVAESLGHYSSRKLETWRGWTRTLHGLLFTVKGAGRGRTSKVHSCEINNSFVSVFSPYFPYFVK